ncbi:MAG: NHL repeat-containing protein [Armatimonadota bacterium]
MISLLCASAAAAAPGEFRDLGVAAPVSESRGFVAVKAADGRNLAIALATDQSERGYLLVADLDSGKVQQCYYPEGVTNSDPFASMLSKNGRFYTGAGPTLLEFDPNTGEYLYQGRPNPKAACFVGEAFADGPDGLIYIGTYPDCRLISFDPQTKAVKDHGILDKDEKYFNYLNFDSAGWAYAGIGTARCNIVAFNPKTGERRQIMDESERKLGTAQVFLGKDGKAYGIANGQYYRLFEGKGEKIERSAAAEKLPAGAFGWGVKSVTLADGRTAVLNLPENYIEVSAKGAETKRFPIDHESGGAQVTSLVVGPDSCVYTSSAHPMHFSRYDPKADKLTDMGPVNRVGGGNICAMATQGQYLAGASYALGIFHVFDTKQPFNGGYGEQPNPREVAVWKEDICRPRTCIAHPDGRTILMAGFAGYGMVGGGLGMYDLQSEKATLITHEDLISNESTIAMRALPGGDIIGGTSIQAPGGGHTTAKTATLYILDWKTKQVVFKINPVPDAVEIVSLEIGPDGLVYGLATGSRLFVFDPKIRKIVHQADLAEYGAVPRQALVLADGKLYAALSKSIVQIAPGTFEVAKIADAPKGISAGAVYTGGRLYFASRARLWSYELK